MKLHSVCDLITNSSTTIYTHAKNNSISMVEDLINKVLETAGISAPAKELFNFSVEADKGEMQDRFFDSFDVVELGTWFDLAGMNYNDWLAALKLPPKDKYKIINPMRDELFEKVTETDKYKKWLDRYVADNEVCCNESVIIRDKNNKVVYDKLAYIHESEETNDNY